MSRDIRSFFKPVQAKKKPPPKIQDDDDDDKPSGPSGPSVKSPKAVVKSKSRSPCLKLLQASKPKETLKLVKVVDLFSSAPVNQSKVETKTRDTKDKDESKEKKQEIQKTNQSKRFNDTLLELDDDEFDIDLNELDKTIDETLKEDPNATCTKMPITPKGKENAKKRKAEDLNASVLTDQEKFERRQSNYQRYLHRGEPQNKGQKEMPEGKPNCLAGMCFLKTGVLDSLDSEEMNTLVKKHGGRTVKTVSRKVNFIVVGEEPGESKMEKARNLGIREITEDDLLDMILIKSGKPAKYKKTDSVKVEDVPEASTSKRRKVSVEDSPIKAETSKLSKKDATPKKETKSNSPTPSEVRRSPRKSIRNNKISPSPPEIKKRKLESPKKFKTPVKSEVKTSLRTSPRKLIFEETSVVKKEPKSPQESKTKAAEEESDVKPFVRPVTEVATENKAWTEKYKPMSLKEIVGQQETNSNMNKLLRWVANWHEYHGLGSKAKLIRPALWAKNDDGSFFKAAILSGPPGVGKTTTATLVAQELNYDIVEFNASDTRSKKRLQEEVNNLLTSKSLSTYFKDGGAPTSKHLLIMDEVDGMSGNEDRGGVQELIALIKSSNVPIICICNDRQHPKIRSLVNHCFDLRFGKIKAEAIKSKMLTVCYREGIKIRPEALIQMIVSTGNDIRQSLNHLAMWTTETRDLSSATLHTETDSSKKDTVIGPWEVVRKVFLAEEQKNMRLDEKSKLFFYDYSIGPLFVQENYLQVEPNGNTLKCVAKAADAISMGEVVESKIRSTNNWSLMETQAFYSSVLPGHYMAGKFKGQINFPGWLGKNSKRMKFQRMAGELQSHMRTSTSATRDAVNLDYIYALRDNISGPLIKSGTGGVSEALRVMKDYNLLREDLDSIMELSFWSNQKDPMSRVESKVKAAFTRAYNKDGPVLPYSIGTVSKKKTTAKADDDMYGESEEINGDEEEENDGIENDGMIKEKKKPTATAAKGKKTDVDASTSKKPAAKGRAKKK